MKTLVYLASGPFKKEYFTLPFDAMYFIDYNSGFKRYYPQEPSHIKFIGKDALLSIDQLKRDNVRIDCLVVINEGLSEGAGHYPIYSDFLMGYLYPLLKKEFILITDLKPYQTTSYKALAKLDWAAEKVQELFPGDSDYINPNVFTKDTLEEATFGQVFKMRKVNLETVIKTRNNKIKVKLKRNSIWSDANDLDYIGLKLSNDGVRLSRGIGNIRTSKDFFSAINNVQNLENKSFEEILRDAESKKAQVLGLTPWGANDYENVLTLLENHQGAQVKEVRFYHLNKNDFAGIYESYADQIIAAYPNFFSHIIQSDAHFNQYLSVIKMGYGSLMQKLCAEITQALKTDEVFNFSEIKIESNALHVKSRSKNQFIQCLLEMEMKLNY